MDELLEPGEKMVYTAKISRIAYIMPIIWLVTLMAFGGVTGLATTKLIITNKRLLARAGLIRRRSLSIPHKQIGLVKVRQGLLGKLFDYGTLIILSEHGNRIILKGISEPVDVQMQLEEAAEMAVLGRKLSQTVMEKW